VGGLLWFLVQLISCLDYRLHLTAALREELVLVTYQLRYLASFDIIARSSDIQPVLVSWKLSNSENTGFIYSIVAPVFRQFLYQIRSGIR
jgi:hypothetical protein